MPAIERHLAEKVTLTWFDDNLPEVYEEFLQKVEKSREMKSKQKFYVWYPDDETKEQAVKNHGERFFRYVYEAIEEAELTPINVLFHIIDNNMHICFSGATQRKKLFKEEKK